MHGAHPLLRHRPAVVASCALLLVTLSASGTAGRYETVVRLTAAAGDTRSVETGNYPWADAVCEQTAVAPAEAGCVSDKFHIGAAIGDPWGAGLRQCTSFVAWWLSAHHGDIGAVTQIGDATVWGKVLASRTDLDPSVGSVAWWASTPEMPAGHVAIVTAVDPVTGLVSIEQYNAFVHGAYSTQRGQRADGYIHLPY